MDGVVILLLVLVWFCINRPSQAEESVAMEIPEDVIQLNPHLNPSMYHDEQAFMLIANELGFH